MVTLWTKSGEKITLRPTKIIAVGLNYTDHIKESSSFDSQEHKLPEVPVLFPQTPNVLIAHEEEIIVPRIVQETYSDLRIDPEAELACVIDRKCSKVSPQDARSYIKGFTCFNDISCRNIQKGEPTGWFRGKSIDTFGPLGPLLLTPEEIGDEQKLNIMCRVNGELRQSANTSQMIFSVTDVISYISSLITLEADDIITTGTPSGIAPLKDGDVIEVEIEKIGILRNRIVFA